VRQKTEYKMKLLVLFACIAAASAYSSFYPGFYDSYKYPVDYYKKDYPIYEKDYHYKDYPWYGKYFKDFPTYGKYYKDFPAYGKYYKDYPYYSQYHKDYPTYEHYGKEFPWYSKYYKDFPYYSKDYPVQEKYFKDYPVQEKYFKDFPGFEKFHKYPYYYKDFPITEKYYKDFPMYEQMFKNFDFAEFFGEKDFTYVKKDFIIFYYKYLVEILDLFKVHYGEYLTHYETFKYDEFYLPAKCHKLTGFMNWMHTTNVDVTKYHEHFFDYFMMCKMVDYVKFIKTYFLHFNLEVMYKDYDLIHGLYGMLGDHGYGLHKYYGDVFRPYFNKYSYEGKYTPYQYFY
jgi:hypothetical protein